MEFLKPRISKIEMPAKIEFREELPKTLIGKLSKKGAEGRDADQVGVGGAVGVAGRCGRCACVPLWPTLPLSEARKRSKPLKQRRIAARVTGEQRALFQHAADLQGRSLPVFLLATLQKERVQTVATKRNHPKNGS